MCVRIYIYIHIYNYINVMEINAKGIYVYIK